MSTNTALVTGGAGFIGSAVASALGAGGYARVAIAGRSSRGDALTAERIAALDVDVDVIVHCAGSASVSASIADPHGERERTVPPFEQLLRRVRERASRARVVLLSSAAVYGEVERVPIAETSAIAPVSPYGRHKRECEALCEQFGRDHGVASVIVRLFSVYGRGLRRQLMWDACVKARAGEPSFAGTGDEVRDWLHVDDAAALVLAAIDHASAAAPVFNGASGAGASVREVVARICRELGCAPPRFTGEARAGDPQRYIADIARARAIGWAPRVDLPSGIAQYVGWFREHG